MRSGFVAKFTFLLSGLIVWAVHFLFVYGVNGIACARPQLGPDVQAGSFVPATVLVATAFCVAATCGIALVALKDYGPGISAEEDASLREFWRFTTATNAGLAAIAILWTAVPALFIRPCS